MFVLLFHARSQIHEKIKKKLSQSLKITSLSLDLVRMKRNMANITILILLHS